MGVLSDLSPERATLIRTLAEGAGNPRIWAGIHYQMDHLSGIELGRKVGEKFVAKAKSEGF